MPKVVYAFYSLSLLSQRGVPLVRKAHVTELQMFQLLACYRLLALNQIPTRAATSSCGIMWPMPRFAICACHALRRA